MRVRILSERYMRVRILSERYMRVRILSERYIMVLAGLVQHKSARPEPAVPVWQPYSSLFEGQTQKLISLPWKGWKILHRFWNNQQQSMFQG